MNNPDVNDEREQPGISPVVGAILMVAIVVVLAAVMLFFVTDLADQPSISQAGITVDESVNGVEVTVHNVQKADSIRILVDGSEVHQSDSVSAGDSVTLIGVSPGDNIVVIGGEGDSENVLKNHEVENAYSPSLSPQVSPTAPVSSPCLATGGSVDPTNLSFLCEANNTVSTVSNDIWVEGNYAYVSGSPGLRVYDLSDPSLPKVAEIDPAAFGKLEKHGNYIYTLEATYGGGDFYILDVSDPTTPTVESTFSPTGRENGFGWTYDNGYVYVGDSVVPGDWSGNMTVADVSNPSSPSVVSVQDFSWNRQTVAMEVVGDRMYVVSDGFTFGTDCTSGLCIPRMITLDISDKTNFQRIDTEDLDRWGFSSKVYYVTPDTFIVEATDDYDYVHVDISNADNPTVTRVDVPAMDGPMGTVQGVDSDEDILYTARNPTYEHTIVAWDISNPTNPVEIAEYNDPSATSSAHYGVVVDGKLYFTKDSNTDIFEVFGE